ncbi:MAG: polysaccharide deacetylase family protein [Oleispira sp.]|nr:polysaccharide deacetylase family protein [Oleispira sp.]MBL4880077.1 polysaccharide deacetylase family protein [Oleispira sp.]
MASTVYMFHAIGTLSSKDSADINYSYSNEKFIEFLKVVGPATSIVKAKEGKNTNSPVLTFDDGHVSNYDAALSLVENNLGCGDFFVNPAMVGKKDFMSWAQLRELSDLGMSIQSHSFDHIYLSDCTRKEQIHQLKNSKLEIESEIGMGVFILAPPGGRYNKITEEISKELGYQSIAISKPGIWRDKEQYLIPRIPVMVNDSVVKLSECNELNSKYVRNLKRKYYITGLAKKTLGNKMYEKLRERIIGGEK